MRRTNSRRDFLKTSTAAGVGFFVAGSSLAAETKSPNEKINFACIGIGGKGESDSADCGRLGNVVAICDIDDDRLEKAKSRFTDAKIYNDYRKMLDEMGGKIDAVTVSTPDHSHAPAASLAMRMGKHCFCQKPLTKSIYEARRLGDLAREKGVKTQMGNQGTATDSLRKTAAVIRAGAVGNVKEVHVWTNRPVWAQGGDRPAPSECPKHVHWDLFIGPAPMRPYAEGYHPFSWRGYWDFGTGALGDMACHTVNMPFMALDLRDPTSVEAEHSGHNKDSFPANSVINYEFPANKWRGALKMIWYDGGKKVAKSMLDGEERSDSGILVIGDAGKIYCPGDYCENGYKLLAGAMDVPNAEFEKSPGHFEEWVLAIQGKMAQAKSNFPDYAGPLSETILLGNLALWAGKKVEWDAKNLKSTNLPELAEIVKPSYRDGYSL